MTEEKKVKKDEAIKKAEEAAFLNRIEKTLSIMGTQNEEVLKKIQRTHSRIAAESKRLRVENGKLLNKISNQVDHSTLSVSQCKSQLKGFEDTLLHIMHNIKKNQFLYAHYPDDWVKDYHSIKEGIKFENTFMDEKGAVNA